MSWGLTIVIDQAKKKDPLKLSEISDTTTNEVSTEC